MVTIMVTVCLGCDAMHCTHVSQKPHVSIIRVGHHIPHDSNKGVHKFPKHPEATSKFWYQKGVMKKGPQSTILERTVSFIVIWHILLDACELIYISVRKGGREGGGLQ